MVGVIREAYISDCGLFRYTLTRAWDAALPALVFVMLNPSKADASCDDPTIKKCITVARFNGYGGILVVNLYPYRATNPKELRKDLLPELNHLILEMVFHTANKIICAWGANARGDPQAAKVLKMIRATWKSPWALRLLKDGTPEHPLFIPGETYPVKIK